MLAFGLFLLMNNNTIANIPLKLFVNSILLLAFAVVAYWFELRKALKR